MVRLTSTVPAYLALAGIPDDDARQHAWVEQYEAGSATRCASCSTGSTPRLARPSPYA